ncbi:discoidin domain-containing protein [Flavitalea flava]
MNTKSALSQVDVLTQHNDLNRTGWNAQETKLNTKNVKAGPFALLFNYPVDDQIYAQPLIVSQVNIPGVGLRDVLFVATVNNTVYALDADSLRTSPFWKVNLSPTGTRPPKNTDMSGACSGNYKDFSGNIGIVGTPVINKATGTIYLVSRSLTTTGAIYKQYLHALDITTGAEKAGSPVVITATANGHGDGNVGGVITFNSQKQNQRPGLLLLNGIVYIGFSSHCDWGPYHGWLLGYDATTLQQKVVYIDTPEGMEGGLWMSGAAPSADAAGNIYLSTGNGTVGVGSNQSDLTNRGESLLKLTPSGSTLTVADFFTPSNYLALEQSDLDFGVTQTLLVPGTNLIMTGCKDGHLYLADRTNMGGYNAAANQNLQMINLGAGAHLRSSFGYYKGSAREFVYSWSENTSLKSYPVIRTNSLGNLDAVNIVSSGLQGPTGNSGAMMAVSSNGAVDSTAILWASHPLGCDANQSVCPAILRAVNANDVTKELWNSNLNPSDKIPTYAKFVCPTIANGRVYIATFSNQLMVYGLTNNGADTCNSPNVALNKTATASIAQASAANAFDGNLNTSWSTTSTATQTIYIDLGARYDLCRIVLHWGAAYGKDYNLQVSDDPATWTNTIQAITGNSSLDNTLNVHASGRYVRMQGITAGTASGYAIKEMEVYGTPTVSCFPPAGLSVSNLTQTGATISWPSVSGATGYSIQYKTVSDASWTTIISTGNSATLPALSCGTDYLYQVATSCSAGLQSAYSSSSSFTTSDCTVPCGPLPTRWTTSDIGNIGIAGSACYSVPTFTLQGSGADIGGNTDAFRFAYITLVGDDAIDARIISQDNSDPSNKVGIMIRETTAPDSRNAFIALTNGLGATFQYRNVTSGSTTSNFINTLSSPAAPYKIRLVKAGSVYSGFISPDDNSNIWTPVGSPVDLGFGAGTNATYAGFAITSHNNTLKSTATADNFGQSTVLPVKLISFTGRNINDQYVALQWATATEQNNDHFEVERKNPDGLYYRTIAEVKGAGNSEVPQQYTAEDHNPNPGLNFYRLKQVDLDGRFAYSPVILIRYDKQPAPLLFPNPASTSFNVVAGLQPVKEVSVFDVSGRNVLRMLNGSGTSSVVVSCDKLTAGIYIVQIKTATQVYVQKLLKQ